MPHIVIWSEYLYIAEVLQAWVDIMLDWIMIPAQIYPRGIQFTNPYSLGLVQWITNLNSVVQKFTSLSESCLVTLLKQSQQMITFCDLRWNSLKEMTESLKWRIKGHQILKAIQNIILHHSDFLYAYFNNSTHWLVCSRTNWSTRL